MTFVKGQSGNPNGKVKAPPQPHVLAQKKLLESIEALHKLATDHNTTIDDRLKAIDKLSELARQPKKSSSVLEGA